ncbi:MAG: DUF2889 domain-containing protein [Acidimicrobiales bacterium]
MLTIPDRAGPHDPLPTTPARRPSSLRRTSSIDSSRPDGLDVDVRVDGRARDLLTDGSGAVAAAKEAHLAAVIDHARTLVSAVADPPVGGFDDLVGIPVASGWRARAADALRIDEHQDPLLNLLVDDLPGASLVSGVALQAAHALPAASPAMREYVLAAADICAGWVADGSMLEAFRTHDQMPAPVGPPAPVLEREDDPQAWHPMAALTPHATRRRRLLDLWAETDGASTHAFEAHFRDSHVAGDGHEQVVHEYLVTGRIDERTRTFTSVEAEARVLPWVECPNALASAGRLVGTQIGDLRARVRTEFVGVSTCTHLNDTLRSLADIEPWLDLMAAPDTMTRRNTMTRRTRCST